MQPLSRLTIDLAAVQQNYRTLQQQLQGGTQCAGVIKADAYGLGVAQVAPALAAVGCKVFFAAMLEEAVALRTILPSAHIGVFAGLQPGEEAEYVGQRLWPVLNAPEQVTLWRDEAKKQGKKLPALLHVDTGMNRLGMSAAAVAALLDGSDQLSGIDVCYMMSHLACASEAGHPLNAEQLRQFSKVRELLPGVKGSFANSAGIFLGKEYHADLARPGAALYGINPTPEKPNPMQSVVTWKARILQLREIDRPMSVSYGATDVVVAGTRLATVGVGYADGFLRNLSHTGQVVIGGTTMPVVGRVTMDSIIVDVTELPEHTVQPGQEAEILGSVQQVDELAEQAGTIGYEMLTSIGKRVVREYLPGKE